MTTQTEILSMILQEVLDLTFNEIEDFPRVSTAWQEFKALAQEVRASDARLGTNLTDAANIYATELATRAFLAGVAFDGKALLLEAARDLDATARD